LTARNAYPDETKQRQIGRLRGTVLDPVAVP